MLATTRKPALANSTDVSKPKPLEEPVTTAIFSGIGMVYHNESGSGICTAKGGKIVPIYDLAAPVPSGGLMLATRNRFRRNSYFQFHPLHTLFSLLGALLLFGMLIWLLAVPAR